MPKPTLMRSRRPATERSAPATRGWTSAWIVAAWIVAAWIGWTGLPQTASAAELAERPPAAFGGSAEPTAAAADCGHQPLPILFEGLGLENFSGRSSIARALHRAEPNRASRPLEMGMSVVGPGSRGGAKPLKLLAEPVPPGPLQAVVKSRLSGLDVSAGVDAAAETIQSGPARWVGGIGIKEEGPGGRSELAVRTSMRYADTERLIRVEVGPRIERPLGGGITFFLDGKAEAETAPSLVEPVATLPGMMGSQSLGFVGFTGRTGLVR